MGVTLVGNRELSLIMNWVPELLGSGEFCVLRHRVVLTKTTHLLCSFGQNYAPVSLFLCSSAWNYALVLDVFV